ncbi:25643_t:CDS:1, partial [Dentiscutata erythropus]
PKAEHLSLMFKANKKQKFTYLDKYKIFKKLVEHNLREKGLLPNSNEELSKISKDAWDRKDSNFEKFIEEYTKEVNLFRRQNLQINIKPYELAVNTETLSADTEIYASDFFNGFPSSSNERVRSIRDFDMIRGNKDVVSHAIQLPLSEKTTSNQNFDIIEGNVNVINDNDEVIVNSLFKKYINEDAYL